MYQYDITNDFFKQIGGAPVASDGETFLDAVGGNPLYNETLGVDIAISAPIYTDGTYTIIIEVSDDGSNWERITDPEDNRLILSETFTGSITGIPPFGFVENHFGLIIPNPFFRIGVDASGVTGGATIFASYTFKGKYKPIDIL